MSSILRGRTVAITEHRFEREFSALIERFGARVISCPLLEEHQVGNHQELAAFIDRLVGDDFDFMVFFTGVGVRFLAAEADARDRSREFIDALRRLTIVGRGPKPHAALAKLGLRVDLAPGRPTSEGLVELLGEVDLSEKSVGIQLYGKPNPEFCSALESMGAHVTTVQVYDYAPASDRARILSFIGMLLDDPVDVLTITSSPQLTSLFDVSDEAGLSERLVRRLNEDVAVAVIGEVADRALLDRGIQAKICPRSPKMAPLAQAIADYYRSEEV